MPRTSRSQASAKGPASCPAHLTLRGCGPGPHPSHVKPGTWGRELGGAQGPRGWRGLGLGEATTPKPRPGLLPGRGWRRPEPESRWHRGWGSATWGRASVRGRERGRAGRPGPGLHCPRGGRALATGPGAPPPYCTLLPAQLGPPAPCGLGRGRPVSTPNPTSGSSPALCGAGAAFGDDKGPPARPAGYLNEQQGRGAAPGPRPCHTGLGKSFL